MLGMPRDRRDSSDGVTRRQVLAGAVATLGARLAPAAERRAAATPGKAKAVLLLYLHGGAPTQDMFDLKPSAPPEVRGEFRPIATNVTGIQVCEHLPRIARWMHRCAVVRSVHHRAGCHNTLPGFTGSEQPVDVNEPVPRDTYPPGMGAVCEYLKPEGVELPHYVAVPNYLRWGWAIKRPGPWGGFLGQRYDPLCGEYDPKLDPQPGPGRGPMWLGAPRLADSDPRPDVGADRLDRRRSLLGRIDQPRSDARSDAFDRSRRRAFGLLAKSMLKTAFDLGRESPRLRERYGGNVVGSSTLVARRLIESGVRFVDVYWDGYTYRVPNNNLDPYWDTHSNNFAQLKRTNLPALDQTVSALFEDLEQRGLFDETLVVMMSDFGRTPRVNGAAGRDHWTSCYSVVFAGAGIRGGTVCGASDAHAAYVRDRPVRPADVCATVYHCLGIDPDLAVRDRAGRPIPVAQGGEPIGEILA